MIASHGYCEDWVRKYTWKKHFKYLIYINRWQLGFPGSSDGQESVCSAGDLGSIPGLGRSPWGGHGNPL